MLLYFLESLGSLISNHVHVYMIGRQKNIVLCLNQGMCSLKNICKKKLVFNQDGFMLLGEVLLRNGLVRQESLY